MEGRTENTVEVVVFSQTETTFAARRPIFNFPDIVSCHLTISDDEHTKEKEAARIEIEVSNLEKLESKIPEKYMELKDLVEFIDQNKVISSFIRTPAKISHEIDTRNEKNEEEEQDIQRELEDVKDNLYCGTYMVSQKLTNEANKDREFGENYIIVLAKDVERVSIKCRTMKLISENNSLSLMSLEFVDLEKYKYEYQFMRKRERVGARRSKQLLAERMIVTEGQKHLIGYYTKETVRKYYEKEDNKSSDKKFIKIQVVENKDSQYENAVLVDLEYGKYRHITPRSELTKRGRDRRSYSSDDEEKSYSSDDEEKSYSSDDEDEGEPRNVNNYVGVKTYHEDDPEDSMYVTKRFFGDISKHYHENMCQIYCDVDGNVRTTRTRISDVTKIQRRKPYINLEKLMRKDKCNLKAMKSVMFLYRTNWNDEKCAYNKDGDVMKVLETPYGVDYFKQFKKDPVSKKEKSSKDLMKTI